jgi:hypothetical protein
MVRERQLTSWCALTSSSRIDCTRDDCWLCTRPQCIGSACECHIGANLTQGLLRYSVQRAESLHDLLLLCLVALGVFHCTDIVKDLAHRHPGRTQCCKSATHHRLCTAFSSTEPRLLTYLPVRLSFAVALVRADGNLRDVCDFCAVQSR